MKFYRVVLHSIPHNSTEAIDKGTLEEARMANMNSLSKKTAQSREGNVDVEPPSSMDDPPKFLTEIGVEFDEGTRPILMIRCKAQSSVHPR
jgi:hypothetical protein